MTQESGAPPEQVARLAELGLLTASLLHELRQPLLSIQATAEFAVSTGSPDEARWLRVLQGVAHMRSLLEAHSGVGRVDEQATDVDVRGPIRAAVQMLEAKRKALAVQVHSTLPSEPVRVHGRETALRQMCINLIHNAIDAVERCPTRVVDVSLACAEHEAVLCVQDSGCGIAPSVVRHLYEPFATSKPAGQGTGLGLYLVRTIASELGGRVQLLHTGAEGTAFEVRLPCAL